MVTKYVQAMALSASFQDALFPAILPTHLAPPQILPHLTSVHVYKLYLLTYLLKVILRTDIFKFFLFWLLFIGNNDKWQLIACSCVKHLSSQNCSNNVKLNE